MEVYSKDLEWNFNNIPEKWSFALKVPNPNSDKETVYIVGFFLTKSVLEKSFSVSWENIIKIHDGWQKTIEHYGSSADNLYVVIDQNSDKSFPFDIRKFALTQNHNQYGWDSHFNIKALNSTFKIATYSDPFGLPQIVHNLRPGVVARGILSIPDDIDLNKPFTIWYGDHSAELNAEGLDTDQ